MVCHHQGVPQARADKPPAALRLAAGRCTLLLGPPSSGKSVLLQALSGRLRPHRGLRVRRSAAMCMAA